MNALAELQRLVTDALLRRSPLADDVALRTGVDALISPGPRLTAVEQLEIYREQFWARHVHSLEDDFGIARYLLGERAFFELASGYLTAHPPRSYDLRGLGRALPQFARGYGGYGADALLCESFRLDWAFMEAFDAPAAIPFDPSTIAHASEDAWAHAKVIFDPSVRPIALAFPTHELRESVRLGTALGRPAPRGAWVVVYRAGMRLHSVEIDPIAFDLLVALIEGGELGPACGAIAQRHGIASADELGPRVGGWFQEWTAWGWVAAVVV